MECEGAGGPGEARATTGPPGWEGKKSLEPASAERAAICEGTQPAQYDLTGKSQ